MFGFNTLVKPEPKQAVVVEENTEEYQAIAHKLNLVVPALHTHKFLAFMAANDLPIYSLPVVIKYMDKIAKRDGNGRGWVWRPMRTQDREQTGSVEWGIRHTEEQVASDYFEQRGWIPNYGLPIPMRVLSRALLIENKSPFKTTFFISDYSVKNDFVKPDPFLLVYLPQLGERFIVDFWDEPGFGINEMLGITKE